MALIWLAATARAQQPSAPTRDTEIARLKESCSGFSFGMIIGCGRALFTDHPLHIAVGSLAPQNGLGAGGALSLHWTPANWRNTLDADAVATPNGAWPAGAYLTTVGIRLRQFVGANARNPHPCPPPRKST